MRRLGGIEGGMKTVPFWGTEVGVVSFCVVVLLAMDAEGGREGESLVAEVIW